MKKVFLFLLLASLLLLPACAPTISFEARVVSIEYFWMDIPWHSDCTGMRITFDNGMILEEGADYVYKWYSKNGFKFEIGKKYLVVYWSDYKNPFKGTRSLEK